MSERGVCICPACGCQFSSDRVTALQGENRQLRDVLADIVDLCNAMREHAPMLNLDAERTIRAGLDAAGWAA